MRQHSILVLLISIFCLSFTSFSQTELTGKISDKQTSEMLMDVRVALLSVPDSSVVKVAMTDEEGNYRMTDLTPGTYILKVTSLEYSDQVKRIELPAGKTVMDFVMKTDTKLIDEVTVEAKAIRVEQKGDTTQYNAEAYKTNPDATVQDLITKMPGITLENGVVKAQGEQITKVMIDGQEFFGDDASAALKNLPAEIVSKIQVYDQASDQAKFTGISDGNEAKALNIVTKAGKNQGQFGKIYAGYGTPNDLYMAGANINFFKGTRRISLVGMSNNVNQQNFSTDDILGVTGSSASQSRGGPGGRGGFGGGDNENYLVSQQNGVSTTHAIGLNYSDKWGKNKNTKVTGSYFFNGAKTDNSQVTSRNYVLSATAGQHYDEDFSAIMKNANHRLNFKFDIALDSMNSLVITPKLSYQGNDRTQGTAGTTVDGLQSLINTIDNNTFSNNKGLTASNSILWRHRFVKPRRTFSANLTGTYNNRIGNSGQESYSHYYDELGADSLAAINQQADNRTNGYGISGRFSYTEPLSKNWSGELVYSPSYTVSDADKRTYAYDSLSGAYSMMDTTLSNVFDNQTIVQEGGVNARFQKNKTSFQLGVSYQNSLLLNTQEFPIDRDVRLAFNSILPNMRFRYEFSKTKNFMMSYRAGTRNPTIDQLQNVIDNSNPLSLSSGNPDLKQQYNHRVFGRFNSTNVQKATNFNIFFGGEMNSNYISTSTVIATSDTIIDGNIALQRGAQYRKPVNLNGSWNARTTVSYGLPLTKLKLNLNFYAGAAYTVLPGLINNVVNESRTSNANGGMTISSNMSENLDFTVGYTLNYNNVVNTKQNVSRNEYFVHSMSARFNWIIKERLVINSNYSLNAYAGLGSGFNQTIMLWNGGIGYKFLKQKQLELRVSVFDILNNNNSITRNVTESYIEDVKSNVLNRYYMLTVTYNIRNFGTKAPETKETRQQDGGFGGPPFGGPPSH